MSGLFIAACIILFVVPIMFVLHSVYEDGFFGRIGLLGISFAAGTFLIEMAGGRQYELLPQTVLMVSAFAVFLVWHLFRFHRRVLRSRKMANEDRAINI